MKPRVTTRRSRTLARTRRPPGRARFRPLNIGRPGGPRRASPQSTSHDSSIRRAVACRRNRATFSCTLRIQEFSRTRPRRAVGIRARRFATRRRAPHRRPRSARVPHDVTRKDTVSQYEASRRPRPAVATIKKRESSLLDVS